MLQNLLPLIALVLLWFGLRWWAKRKRGNGANRTAIQQYETLVSEAEYEKDSRRQLQRRAIPAGVAAGVLFGISSFFITSGAEHPLYSPVITAPASGLFFGLIFAFLFPKLFWITARQQLISYYNGTSVIGDPPPSRLLVYYRLPCNCVGGLFGIAGFLYLGRGGLCFIASKPTSAATHTIEISPLIGIRVSLIDTPKGTILQRLLRLADSEPQIEVASPVTTFRLRVAEPRATYERLTQRLDTLRQIPS